MNSRYKSCIDACLECAIQCNHCSTACLLESDVKMLTKCVQLERECSVLCFAAAGIMGLDGKTSSGICKLCAEVCNMCAEECEKHAHMEHCKECAEACRKCAKMCLEIK